MNSSCPSGSVRTWALGALILLGLSLSGCPGAGGGAPCPKCPEATPSCPACPPCASSAAPASAKPQPAVTPRPTAAEASPAPAPAVLASGREETRRFLDRTTPRYERSIARARAWLDRLRVDPLELRGHGIKGKKKLVELLDSYVRLHAIAPEADKPALMKRIREVVAITYEPRYHDMLRIGDKPFKQDSTSYLRAAYLMEQLGLDTALYRQEIQKAHARLNGHMQKRGPHQRMAFHWYYEHFGLTEPFPLAQGFELGIIKSRLNPYRFTRRLQAYNLSHEIFIPYHFGEKLDADFFSADDKAYLRRVLERLTVHYALSGNADLTAELVSCMRFLKLTDSPIYREALEYLLEAQRPDGSWGNYEHYRKRMGDWVQQGFYLHTTAVAIDALSVAYHFREDR